MIGTAISIFKAVSGFAKAYKLIIAIVAVLGVVGTVFVYIGNHGEMKAEIIALKSDLAACNGAAESFSNELVAVNGRIREGNVRRLEEIAEARVRLDAANAATELLYRANEELTIELGESLFETLEAIQDDEDFADWAYGPVHVTGWSLLRDAREGRITSQ